MRNISVSEIIALARLRTDTVYSQAVTDSELLTLLAQHYRNLYNVMSTKDESLFLLEIPITPIVDGEFTLPADFYKTMSVFIRRGEFDYPLDRTGYQSRGVGRSLMSLPSWHIFKNGIRFTPKTAVGPLYLSYLPLPTNIAAKATGKLGDSILPTIEFTAVKPGAVGNTIVVTLVAGGTAGSELVSVADELISVTIEDGVSTVAQIKAALDVSDAAALITTKSIVAGALSAGSVTLTGATETIDLVCSEDDYLIASLCVDIAKREESDYKQFEADKQEAMGNIITYLAPRDNGNPVKVRDVQNEHSREYFPRGWRR